MAEPVGAASRRPAAGSLRVSRAVASSGVDGGLVAGLVAMVVGLPLAALVVGAAGGGWQTVAALLDRPGVVAAVRNTLWLAAVVTLVSVTLGLAAALVTERSAAPARDLLRAALVLGVIVPPFVSGLSWTRAYGTGGLSDRLLGVAWPGLYGPGGVVVVLVVHAVPLAYLILAGGLAVRAQPDLERAARASGANPLTAFATVTLPALRAALAGAAAVAWVSAVNNFGVPAVLGRPAGFGTATTELYRNLVLSADPAAFVTVLALALALVAATLVVVGLTDHILGAGGRGVAGVAEGGPGGPVRRRRPGAGAWAAGLALWAWLAMSTGVPLVALALAALTRAPGLAPVPANWTLTHLITALSGRAAGALGRSLLLAVVTACLLVFLGGAVAALSRVRRGGGWARMLVTLGFGLPGSALAVGVLLAYGRWLTDTLLILLLAYLAKFWALGHRPLAGGLDRLAPDLLRAARSSGARPATVLRTVVAPLLAPAIAGAWTLVFLFAFHEVTISSLLHGPATATLAVVVLDLQQLGDSGGTAALALVLTVIVLLAALPLLSRRLRTVLTRSGRP